MVAGFSNRLYFENSLVFLKATIFSQWVVNYNSRNSIIFISLHGFFIFLFSFFFFLYIKRCVLCGGGWADFVCIPRISLHTYIYIDCSTLSMWWRHSPRNILFQMLYFCINFYFIAHFLWSLMSLRHSKWCCYPHNINTKKCM